MTGRRTPHGDAGHSGREGLGFVVAINAARRLLRERPSFWSGLDGSMITGPIAQILKVPQSTRYLVKAVSPGSLDTVPSGAESSMPVLRLREVIELKGRHP